LDSPVEQLAYPEIRVALSEKEISVNDSAWLMEGISRAKRHSCYRTMITGKLSTPEFGETPHCSVPRNNPLVSQINLRLFHDLPVNRLIPATKDTGTR